MMEPPTPKWSFVGNPTFRRFQPILRWVLSMNSNHVPGSVHKESQLWWENRLWLCLGSKANHISEKNKLTKSNKQTNNFKQTSKQDETNISITRMEANIESFPCSAAELRKVYAWRAKLETSSKSLQPSAATQRWCKRGGTRTEQTPTEYREKMQRKQMAWRLVSDSLCLSCLHFLSWTFW